MADTKLAALREARPLLNRIVIVAAIREGQWYHQEALLTCAGCGAEAVFVVLLIAEDLAPEAMALWPEAQIDRNAWFGG